MAGSTILWLCRLRVDARATLAVSKVDTRPMHSCGLGRLLYSPTS